MPQDKVVLKTAQLQLSPHMIASIIFVTLATGSTLVIVYPTIQYLSNTDTVYHRLRDYYINVHTSWYREKSETSQEHSGYLWKVENHTQLTHSNGYVYHTSRNTMGCKKITQCNSTRNTEQKLTTNRNLLKDKSLEKKFF